MGFEKIKSKKQAAELKYNKLESVKILEEKKVKKKLSKKEKEKLKEEKKFRKQEVKKLKLESKYILKDTTLKLPFLDITEFNAFRLKDNNYLDIFQVESMDISTFNEDEILAHIIEWSNFLRTYSLPHKIVGMNFPVNTRIQRAYTSKMLSKCANETYRTFLEDKNRELAFIEKGRYNEEFFLMIFGVGEENFKENMSKLLKCRNAGFYFNKLDIDKKVKIIYKLNNMNSKIL